MADPKRATKITATLLAAACAGIIAPEARASTYDESISGDTSNVGGSPTLLPTGTDQVKGSVNTFGDNSDNFIVPIPATGLPTQIKIDYAWAPGVDVASLTIKDTNGGLIGFFGDNGPPASLTATLPANASVQFGVNTFETGSRAYTFSVTVLPEPGSAALLGLTAAALLGRRSSKK